MIKAQCTSVIVNDLKESIAFYRDVLGFREGYHVDLPGGAGITVMNSDGASVELIEGKQFPIGIYAIVTDVDDLDKTLEELKAHGCTPVMPVIPTTAGRQTFIVDPNGARICLIEHKAECKEIYMKK